MRSPSEGLTPTTRPVRPWTGLPCFSYLMAQAQLAVRLGQLSAIAMALGFLIPAAINDTKDLTTRMQGRSIPQCAVWSVTRPPCRNR